MNKKILLVAVVLIVGAFLAYQMFYGGTVENIADNLGVDVDIPSLDLGGDQPSEPTESTSSIKEFNVIAKQWEFDPNTIEVDFGDTVVLNIESVDVDHGIMISEFGVNEKLLPGENVRVEFIASKKGTFSFFCNVFCGSGHSQMDGTIIVN